MFSTRSLLVHQGEAAAIKILHVVPSLGASHGGVSVSVRELGQGLARLGVQVHLWTTNRAHNPLVDEPMDEHLRADGVEVRYFETHPSRWFGSRYAYSPALGLALRKSIPQFDLVHIHALWLYPTLIAARICRQTHVPYVLSPCGGLDPYGLRLQKSLKWIYGFFIERRTLAGASLLHFTSPLEQRQARTFGTRTESIVIPRSLSVESMPPTSPGAFRKRHPELNQRRIILFLGRLHPKKRLDLIAEAFKIVASRRDDAHLVIAGPDDGAGAATRKFLGKAQLLDRVTFTGLLSGEGKWEALRESRLLVLPSEEENFGVTALEAMAVGVPVLLSPQVGLSEWVARAQAGAVVQTSPAAWADWIGRLLGDESACQDMGRAGRQLAETEFSTHEVALRMRKIYEGVLSRTCAPSP